MFYGYTSVNSIQFNTALLIQCIVDSCIDISFTIALKHAICDNTFEWDITFYDDEL